VEDYEGFEDYLLSRFKEGEDRREEGGGGERTKERKEGRE
jgi:hypothetical protein